MLSFRLVTATLVVAGCAIFSVEGQFGFFRPFFGGRPRGPPRRPAPAPFRGGGGGSCPTSGPNHSFGGQQFVISWQNGPKSTCGQFTGSGASSYCSSMGMRPISLNDGAKAQHFIDLLARDFRQTYFWTSGRLDHRGGRVNWGNGASQQINQIPYWSRTGG